MGLVIGLYLLPGVLFFFLAWRMERLAQWAFITAMALAGFVVCALAIRTIIATDDPIGMVIQLVIDAVLGAPCVYLIVRSWTALPELRFVRGPARAQGFPVITAKPPVVTPPPPARQMRASNRPRRG